jgi:hypothetical protein
MATNDIQSGVVRQRLAGTTAMLAAKAQAVGDVPQPCDEIAVAAKVRGLVRAIVVLQPIGAGILMSAGSAPVNRAGNNGSVMGQALQLSVDAEFLHHAFHQGGSHIDGKQEIIEAHILDSNF